MIEWICTECGQLLDGDDVQRRDERHVPFSREVLVVCPICGSAVAEADVVVAVQTASRMLRKLHESQTREADLFSVIELLDWVEETL